MLFLCFLEIYYDALSLSLLLTEDNLVDSGDIGSVD